MFYIKPWTRRNLRVWLFLVALLASDGPRSSFLMAKEWSIDDVIAVAQAREDQVATIDLQFRLSLHNSKDSQSYLNSELPRHRRAVAKFFGQSMTDDPLVDLGRESPPEFFRVTRNDQKHFRNLMFNEPPNQRMDNFYARECHYGKRWERFTPGRNEPDRVHLADKRQIGQNCFVSGLDLPAIPGYPDSIANALRQVKQDKGLLSISEKLDYAGHKVLELVFEPPLPPAIPSGVIFSQRYTLTLDISRNLVPISIVVDDRTFLPWDKEKQSILGMKTFRYLWADYKEVKPNLWLSHSASCLNQARLEWPTSGAEFTPLRDSLGKEIVLTDGMKVWDYSKTVAKTYDVTESRFTTLSLVVNEPVDEPLCPCVYKEGTLVQDDTSHQLFTLVKAGSPHDSANLSKPVIAATAPNRNVSQAVSPQNMNRSSIFLKVNAIVLLGVMIILAYCLIRRSRTSSERLKS